MRVLRDFNESEGIVVSQVLRGHDIDGPKVH